MSQIPTNDEIPANSKKAQQEAIEKQQRPEVTPFEGDVMGAKRKKSTVGAWLKKNFLSDRKPSEILMSVLEDNIVPGIKDNLRNSVVSGIDSFIYNSAKPSSGNPGNNSVSYNNVYRSQPSQPKPDNQTQNNNGMDLSSGFVNPCFRTREQARQFLIKMKAYDYPTLSVHTMYMMMSKHIDYTWDAYGWTKEEIAGWDPEKIITHISSRDFPWMIDLPQAHVIS